jgi:26S proteasome non-ATPase regulatory subunit 10
LAVEFPILIKSPFATLISLFSRNDTGQSALHYACSKDHMAIVLALINAEAELNPQDDRGATPLHRAACKVSIFIIKR